jgi:hypothetical protein
MMAEQVMAEQMMAEQVMAALSTRAIGSVDGAISVGEQQGRDGNGQH